MTEPFLAERLRPFVLNLGALLARNPDEATLFRDGRALLQSLIRHDDWLPEAYARPDPARYQQYLLHCDSLERFSVVAFVWGPGQSTPVHDHTVWGLVGVLRGAETSQAYHFERGRLVPGETRLLKAGEIEALSPNQGDIHKVSNAAQGQTSISIHVYGANIGAVERSTFDEAGRPKPFISGYANTSLPNLWDRSRNPVLAAAQ
ncbi:MAG: cysteine dioxygenase [Caulobacteraceae bacterium]|nr:cysteine dioxygenase [Caulobacteraceae bacterium]